jgi:hypothetical protein
MDQPIIEEKYSSPAASLQLMVLRLSINLTNYKLKQEKFYLFVKI